MSEDRLYGISQVWFALALLVAVLAVAELGWRWGRRRHAQADDGERNQVSAISAAVLGLLALLIGFTFSMAVNRFDLRQGLVLEEANAIGTTALRAQLLQPAAEAEVVRLLRQYVQVRLDFHDAGIDERRLHAVNAQTAVVQQALWRVAMQQARGGGNAAQVNLFIMALNDTIDLHGKRLAAMRNHVPPTVILLLLLVTLGAVGLVAYGGGLHARRQLVAQTVLAVLLVLAIMLIVDLDRPRRGLILVSQQSMLDTQQELDAAVLPVAGD
ncbi:MAG: hypothetical protein EPO12_06720 [Aquabacterium sp.]|nr:MAG: hypothetical protein EPO12_06720 [Aquabacterium sp.]